MVSNCDECIHNVQFDSACNHCCEEGSDVSNFESKCNKEDSNKGFDEDAFLLDYIEWQKGNIHVSDYAKKYNMTVWELQDKLREYRFSISNIRR